LYKQIQTPHFLVVVIISRNVVKFIYFRFYKLNAFPDLLHVRPGDKGNL